ncbi:MAG: hypothetical protein WKI04_02835 [Ferruginibacter sp.]
MGNSNLLFESIFKRKLRDPGTPDYLKEITKQYPYFSPAQFFLLLQSERGTAAYHELAAKTAVLFNNVHWLQFQLQEQEATSEESAGTELSNDNPSIDHKPGDDSSAQLSGPPAKVEYPGINNNGLAEKISTVSDLPHTDDASGGIDSHQPDLASQEIVPETLPGEKDLVPASLSNQQQISASGIGHSEPKEEDTAKNGDDFLKAPLEEEVETIVDADPRFTPPQQELKNGIGDPGNTENIRSESRVTDVVDDTPDGENFNYEHIPLVNTPEEHEGPLPDQEMEPLKFRLNIDPPAATSQEFIFEPLHTSDYFASLGIKLSEEIKPSDKLGKQLKSFTEWLKTMKKVHTDQLPPLSGQADMSIQKLAEQSNVDDVVLTEAMADVLLLQGKPAKARELYKKLSLLNPSKSTYFAAKIDQLKGE